MSRTLKHNAKHETLNVTTVKKKRHWSKACRNTRQVSEVKEEYDSDPFFMGEVTLIDTVKTGSRVNGQPSYR